MTELKPCPFCGSGYVTAHGINLWAVDCAVCGAVGPEADTEAKAIAAWNERAEG